MDFILTLLTFIAAFVFLSFVWRIFSRLIFGRGRGPLQSPLPRRQDETWGGKRVAAPNPLPTDPNHIPLPDFAKMGLPPAPHSIEPPTPSEPDPYAPAPASTDGDIAPQSTIDPTAERERRLAELESYKEQGIISDKEYRQMRRDIMRGR